MVLLVLGAGLTACSSDEVGDAGAGETRTARDGETFNEADVRFATEMIPHHAQAVQMVVLTQGRRLDPEVEQLAHAIRDAQVPEVQTMSDWLQSWGEDIPETSLDHANAGHDMDEMHGGVEMDMPGAMSAEQMQELANAGVAEFQDLWLRMMIEHHEGAIEMADDQADQGEHDEALALAEAIIDHQADEIETMRQLLGQ